MRGLGVLTWAVLIFSALPLLVVIGAAFTAADYLAFPPPSFGVKWFALALSKSDFVDGLVLSVELAALNALCSTLLGIMVAWSLTQTGRRLSRIGFSLFSLPVMVPSMLIGVAALQFWAALAVRRSLWVLLIGHLILTGPLAIRTMAAAFQTFDRTLEMAAYTLGASRLRAMWRVTLPSVLPGIIASLALTFLISFDDVTVAVFLSAPGVRTLPVVIFNYLDQNLSPAIASVSVVIIALAILVILVIERSVGLGRVFGAKGFESGRAQ